ncbi:tetratricopeptide repeat protein 5-like [Atheta coriaria]|uniref:tetratricopeptide repeat protein 5-like n=1 Tax=Dalotia coriaria TaxID=877792 RepID=UPI0031F3C6B5
MSSFEMNEDNERSEEELCAAFELLEVAAKELYDFRDHYFEHHNIEDAIKRNTHIEDKLQGTMKIFEENKDCEKKCRAKYYYLKGYILNVVPTYCKEAEELLFKAVKLDPKLIRAWNELGDCYCKKNNLQEAAHCFDKALNYEKNKVSLRNLSILMRLQPVKSSAERLKNIELGLKYAKEAVQLDTQDGSSWAVLGNAYLSSFFGISQNPKTLQQCLSAYTQAEKDIVTRNTTDLHYNKAIMLKYEEEYLPALEAFDRAISLDPTWEAPELKRRQFLNYLKEINEMVATTGKMKVKKLNQLLQTLDSKHLGPYGGGTYISTNGQKINLQHVHFNDLKPGLNEQKVVLGKVVCSVRNEDTVPFTFCLVDKIGTCVVATIYNLADGKGVIIGHSVAIPEPYLSDIDFKYKSEEYKFRLIRIETPLILVVNGKKANRDLQAGVQMSLFKKFD